MCPGCSKSNVPNARTVAFFPSAIENNLLKNFYIEFMCVLCMRLSMLTKFFIILFGGLALGFVFYSMLSIVSFQSQKISDNVSGYAQPVLQNPQLPSGRGVQTPSATK